VSLEDISDQISGASSAGADKALGLNNLWPFLLSSLARARRPLDRKSRRHQVVSNWPVLLQSR
jgi:hypothetical protein